ncbi:MAG: thioredoxin-disulfide reductase [Gemmatimonadota bacterium]|nr:thioredoxin-disulfide reductase [Gemmatimonadota bacterium]|tara:strand:- start:6257 stop:7261 length:1005 start_codon:yes stop_codon:yes gene_type:complete
MSERQHEQVVIIGSGPAGWTAAIYAARAQLSPLVIEGAGSRTMIPGGQLMFTTEVENYPGFPEGVTGIQMMTDFREQAVRFDTRVITEDVAEVDFSVRPFLLKTSGGTEIESDAVIIATGANANWIGLDNEERLAQSGGGVSACAVCDGALPHFRNQVIAIVGGGDSAMEDALYMVKFAKEVVVVHRREELRASKIMQERAFAEEKIRFEWNQTVVDVLGDDVITGVRLRDSVTDEERELEVGGLFVAIGHDPNTAFLNGQVALKDNGFVETPTSWRTTTSVPGVFAAGDVMDDFFKQAVTAAGTGCMAALEAERWLSHGGAESATVDGAAGDE